jgi:hypothetical protein
MIKAENKCVKINKLYSLRKKQLVDGRTKTKVHLSGLNALKWAKIIQSSNKMDKNPLKKQSIGFL